MNQAASYVSSPRADSAAPAANLFRDLVAVMPIVILYKSVRTALGNR